MDGASKFDPKENISMHKYQQLYFRIPYIPLFYIFSGFFVLDYPRNISKDKVGKYAP
jgi:hypothetical protein